MSLGVVLAVLLGTAMIAAAILYWTNVPVALAAVSESPARPGLIKAVIKTSFQSVVYPLAFFLMARAALVWAGQIARAMAGESKGSEGVGIIGRS
ncbi:MAG: hypothetical protein U5R14_15645 [Gemmatimonadota bacterium]|nr:hypothetical protein [Gemmatimonadota bacterium]